MNKGLSLARRKSLIHESSMTSGSFRNLVGSTFPVLGTSYTKKTLFCSFFWIQGLLAAQTSNVSCICMEIKTLRLAHFGLGLGKEVEPERRF